MLTSRGPYGRFEHLLTDGAVEIIFGVGRGRGELLGHVGRWGIEVMAAAAAQVAASARGPTHCVNQEGAGNRVRKRLAPGRRRGPGGAGPGGAGPGGAGRGEAGQKAEALRPHAPGEGKSPGCCSCRGRTGRRRWAGGSCRKSDPARGHSLTWLRKAVATQPSSAPPASFSPAFRLLFPTPSSSPPPAQPAFGRNLRFSAAPRPDPTLHLSRRSLR